MNAQPRFSLTISMHVLEQLGINLYSNVAAVLSESVANAYDADATEIRIEWNKEADSIVITDNGLGMTEKEVNARFLTVGYNRRDQQPGRTPLGRHPMGRKGIGKLSLFSIANVVKVETVKNGEQSALLMRLEDIRSQIGREGGDGTYYPEELPIDGIDFEQGTRITLTELRRRHTPQTTAALRRRLARRFSIIGAARGFRMYIGDDEVTPADREYYKSLQYLWTYGDQAEIEALCSSDAMVFDRSNALEDASIEVTGWIGTVREVKDLKDEEGENLNRISIDVRGKLAQEDILADFPERGVYASYLIGDLQVNGLDLYDGPGSEMDEDAATSSRQRIVEDDERYQELKRLLRTELKFIQNEWSKLRAEAGTTRALEIPEVRDWIGGLRGETKEKAKRWIGRLNNIRVDDLNEQKQLIKHSVIAFEFHRLHETLGSLEAINDDNLPATLELFREMDGLESSLYGQIVMHRIEVIRALQAKVDENALEKAIQSYLFDHLWLLDPSWERAEGTEFMESRVNKMFKDIDAKLTKKEREGRLDIAYRKTAGEHVVIELKRPERRIGLGELISQVQKYRSGMQKLLQAQGTPLQPIEIIVVLGKEPSDWTHESRESLKAFGARVVYYDQLLHDAEVAYEDYLDKRRYRDSLGAIFKAIEDYAPETNA